MECPWESRIKILPPGSIKNLKLNHFLDSISPTTRLEHYLENVLQRSTGNIRSLSVPDGPRPQKSLTKQFWICIRLLLSIAWIFGENQVKPGCASNRAASIKAIADKWIMAHLSHSDGLVSNRAGHPEGGARLTAAPSRGGRGRLSIAADDIYMMIWRLQRLTFEWIITGGKLWTIATCL